MKYLGTKEAAIVTYGGVRLAAFFYRYRCGRLRGGGERVPKLGTKKAYDRLNKPGRNLLGPTFKKGNLGVYSVRESGEDFLLSLIELVLYPDRSRDCLEEGPLLRAQPFLLGGAARNGVLHTLIGRRGSS